MEAYELNGNQKVIYTYRKYIFIINKSVPLMIISSITLFILAVIFIPEPLILFMTIVLLGETIFIRSFYKKMVSMKLSVDDEGIHFENYQKKFIIAYSHLESIGSKRLSSLGGWVTISSSYNERFRITVAMKNIGEFFKEVHDQLVAHERQDLANSPLLLKAYHVATFIDSDFRRTKYFGVATIIYLVIAIAFAQIMPIYGYPNVALAFLISLFLVLVVHMMNESVFYKNKQFKHMKELGFSPPIINEEAEKKNIHLFLYLSAVFHIILTVIFLFIPTIG